MPLSFWGFSRYFSVGFDVEYFGCLFLSRVSLDRALKEDRKDIIIRVLYKRVYKRIILE